MMTIPPEYIAELRTALTLFHDGVGPLIQAHKAAPAEKSQASTEQAACTDGEAIITACGVGMQLIELGADHLSALVKIVTEPMEVLAAWTCVRSMLEGCSVSAWLLDPAIDLKTRVGRTFALRYEGMKSELRLVRMAKRQSEIDVLEARLAHVEQQAVTAGLPRVLDKNGKRIGIGQQMP